MPDLPAIAPLVFRNRIYSTDYGTTRTASTIDTAMSQIGKRIGGGWHSVREFGAVGDGIADDSAAIQAALDGAMGTLYFPPGVYNVSGSGAACLTLTRNIDIVGCNGRMAYIRATAGTNATSILRVSFSENWGFGNVRNWRFANMSMEFTNSVGLHALHIDGGYGIFTSEITNSWLNGRPANAGHGIRIDSPFYYSRISQCTLTSVYMNTQDANTIEKCLITSSTIEGVTFNLDAGVRNNTVRECCFITRKDALRVIDGSNIRFVNNQCEQLPGAASTSPSSSMVRIEGATRTATNVIIAENNFGGGTNLDRLIYLDNANQAVIEKNHLVAVGLAPRLAGKEIETTPKARYTVIRPDNFVMSQTSNPRTRTAFRAEVLDAGEGTTGVLKELPTESGWVGGDFFKDDTGTVHFWETLSGGATAPDVTIGTMPVGFRPATLLYLTAATSCGVGVVSVSPATGEIKVVCLPGNAGLTLPGFPSGTTATP